MKKYGLRIGNTGVEFSTIEARDKAIKDFTQGNDVIISNSGVRYVDGIGSFSVYDRDTKDIMTNCEACQGIFDKESCTERDYPRKYYGQDKYSIVSGYICDACYTKANKAKEIFEAQQLLSKAVE